MPFEKYRDVSEVPDPPLPSSDEELVERIRFLWMRTFALARPHFKPGVRKYRNVEEMKAGR